MASALLLDSNVLFWTFYETRRIHKSVQEEIINADVAAVSHISIWELGIKAAQGKLKINIPELLQKIEEENFDLLSIEMPHILTMLRLPRHHRDPFDRMLVAQAMCEDMALLSADRQLAPYGTRVKIIEKQ